MNQELAAKMNQELTVEQFPSWAFQRADEGPDHVFYSAPRLVVHLDEPSLAAITQLYRELLPADGVILDLMSSWKSHLPDDVQYRQVCGLGLNAEELRSNNRLDEFVVHDVNVDPRLPLNDGSFDAAVIALSVQYLIHPVELFAEARRTLKPNGLFIITYSHRMFPTKAIRRWQSLDMAGRRRLIETYFRLAGGFGEMTFSDRSPNRVNDPVHTVWARRPAGVAGLTSRT